VPALLCLADAREAAPGATDAVRCAALAALAALMCAFPPARDALLHADGLPLLAAALQLAEDGASMRHAAAALRHAAPQDRDRADALRVSGALDALCSVVWQCAAASSPAEQAVTEASAALSDACAGCAANAAAVRESEVIPCLVALLAPGRPPASAAAAARLLAALAQHGGETERAEVRAAGGVPALQALLQRTSGDDAAHADVRADALAALQALQTPTAGDR
jgi:hypothetical protein